MNMRKLVREWLLAQEGKPYVWTAKGELRSVRGRMMNCFDCSGLVTCALIVGGHPRICIRHGCDARLRGYLGFHNAQRLCNDFEPTDAPAELDLAFYGADLRHVDHVMFVWGDGRAYGASGGNRYSLDPALSLQRKQVVQFKASVRYRPDFLGFRKFPIKET